MASSLVSWPMVKDCRVSILSSILSCGIEASVGLTKGGGEYAESS